MTNDLHTISLSADVGRWQAYIRRKSSKGFSAFSRKVFERDDYTCRFCGFQAQEFQEIISVDHDYSSFKMENSLTACCFCHQCVFLETVGLNNFGGGTLIYCPEVSQANISSLCHVLFCAMVNNTAYKSSAQSIYRSFKFRSQQVDEHFGEGASEPSVFGQLLVDYQARHQDMMYRDEWLSNIRLLPSRAKFKKQIEHWATTALAELSQT